MGGAQSPFFAAQLIILLFSGVYAFPNADLVRIFAFTAANGTVWIALSLYSENWAADLPRFFVIKYNAVLMFCGMACLTDFLGRWKNQKCISDIQAQRCLELEGQLVHTEKLAEIGKLVATTAHELAQPAQVIMTSSSMLKQFVSRGQVNLQILEPLSERLLAASERFSHLLLHLKDFSRKEVCVSKTKIDMREPVSSVGILLDYDLRNRGIRFDMSLPADPIWIMGDAHRLQQVMLNLANNARDASSLAVNPTVAVRCEKFASWVRVTVTNNGAGIPLEAQSRLFEPYFTTKSKGEGTGLGLAICKQLVEEHAGRILFSSSNEKTVFVMDLPLLREHEETRSEGLIRKVFKRASIESSGIQAGA